MGNFRNRRLFQASVFLAAAMVGLAAYGEDPKAQPRAKPSLASKLKKADGEWVSLFNKKNLQGWRVPNKFDYKHHGRVAVEKGEIVLEKGAAGTAIAIQGDPPRMNYEISLEAKRVEGDDFFCGLTFPVEKSQCSLILGGWGGSATGLSNIDNMSAIENETTGFEEFKRNQWYRIRLRVSEQKIEAWLGEDQIVDLKTKDRKFSIWWEQEPVMPLGIATWYTSARLRNIKMRSLPPSAKKEKKKEKKKEEK